MKILDIMDQETNMNFVLLFFPLADVPPAMALGVEPAEHGLMQRNPRSPKRGVLTRASLAVILFQSMVMTLMTFGVYMQAVYKKSKANTLSDDELQYYQSEAFAFLTCLQLLQGFLSRTMKNSVFKTNFFSNPWMIYGVLTSFTLMIIGIFVPGFNETILELVPVTGVSWAKIAVGCVIQLTLSEIEKLILRMTGATL